jgi:HK97 family phage portal protein
MVRNGRSYTLKDFENDFVRFFYGGEKATSGLLINEETAMKFATVYSCIRIISEDIGMLPIEIRKWRDPKNPEKGSDMAYDHPLYDVLFAEPNPEMTSMILEETLQSHVLASGNGYAYKVMNGRGQVTGLKLLNWYSIRAERNESTGAVEYKFDDRGKEITLRFDEVFHIPGLGFDGLSGYSPIRMHMDAIGLGMAAEKFASYFYANGANVGGFIEMPNAVKDKEEMKKEFDAKFTGLGKSHKVIFLENGMKFQKMVMPLQEAQFVETRKYQDQQIAAIYRMPMVMLQNSDKLTYNNAEQQDLAYTKHTLIPWVVRWEQSIQTRLLTKAERLAGYFARFNTDAMLRGDSLTTAQVLQAERQNGIITGNEWRAVKNKNPRPEPEADRLVINGNMRDISVINSVDPVSGQQFKKKEGDEDAE